MMERIMKWCDAAYGIKGVAPDRIFIGNGSDEAIDLAFRIFCEPRIDNALEKLATANEIRCHPDRAAGDEGSAV